MIFCRFVANRAILIAFSFASAPPLVKKNLLILGIVTVLSSAARVLRDSVAIEGAM